MQGSAALTALFNFLEVHDVKFKCACSLGAVVSKIGIDQTIMAPLGTVAFFSAMKTMERKPRESLQMVKVGFAQPHAV